MQPEPNMPADAQATRAAIIGARKTPAEIAMALRCCERTVINEQRVPHIKFLGRRYVEPSAVADALLAKQCNAAPRRRGRPSNRAAA